MACRYSDIAIDGSNKIYIHDGLLSIRDFNRFPAPLYKGSMPYIFDFYHTTKGEKGAGLGLAICKKLVEAHKGWIKVESASGKTVFSVFLPEM